MFNIFANMDYKKLVVRGISYSQTQTGAYALLLEHPETSIKLPVVIGGPEAQSISIGLEKNLKPPRPLTHDLFSDFISKTNYTVTSVVIHQIVDGVFFSNIVLKNNIDKEEIILDARTSDAVAMAVRFDSPIYTTEQVLTDAGIILDINEEISSNKSENTFVDEVNDFQPKDEKIKEDLSILSIEDLHILLESAVTNEDYDRAAEIQEELIKRKKKID